MDFLIQRATRRVCYFIRWGWAWIPINILSGDFRYISGRQNWDELKTALRIAVGPVPDYYRPIDTNPGMNSKHRIIRHWYWFWAGISWFWYTQIAHREYHEWSRPITIGFIWRALVIHLWEIPSQAPPSTDEEGDESEDDLLDDGVIDYVN